MFNATLVGYIKRYVTIAAGTYAALFLISYLLQPLPQTTIFTAHELYQEYLLEIIVFSLAWTLVMVSIYLFLARKVEVDRGELFLHMGAIALLGPVCEVAINHFCRYVFGQSLWVYHFLPVHGHDTSLYSFFVWAMYGCHLYFIDKAFVRESAVRRTIVFAMILSVDAIVLEFALNISSIYFLGTYIFFYVPNDVHHLTTLLVMPFYFLGGILAYEVINVCGKRPVLCGLLALCAGFVFTFVFR